MKIVRIVIGLCFLASSTFAVDPNLFREGDEITFTKAYSFTNNEDTDEYVKIKAKTGCEMDLRVPAHTQKTIQAGRALKVVSSAKYADEIRLEGEISIGCWSYTYDYSGSIEEAFHDAPTITQLKKSFSVNVKRAPVPPTVNEDI